MRGNLTFVVSLADYKEHASHHHRTVLWQLSVVNSAIMSRPRQDCTLGGILVGPWITEIGGHAIADEKADLPSWR